MDLSELWLSALKELEKSLSKAHLLTYFKDSSLHSYGERKVTVAAANPFSLETMKTRHTEEILKALQRHAPEIVEIDFIISEADAVQQTKVQKQLAKDQPHSVEAVEGISTKLLNSQYRMENFIVGPHNELAAAVARKVITEPGKSYNPLFIYGGVGLGKTHLLQAIGNEILDKDPKKKVVYTTTEQFTNDLMEALRKTRGEAFRKKYRNIDLLIIDDIQFLAQKEKTQEEFFHTFNVLHDHHKQIVISSDRPPDELKGIMERLVSRFQSGITVEIGMPDSETRLAILQKKIQEEAQIIDMEILEYMANSFEGSVREMEGILKQVLARLDLNQPVSVMLVEELLPKKKKSTPGKTLTAQNIIEEIAREYGVDSEDLIGASRKEQVVEARQVAMYIIRKNLKKSFEDIGRVFGNKNHATVLHSVKKIESELHTNEKMKKLLKKF